MTAFGTWLIDRARAALRWRDLRILLFYTLLTAALFSVLDYTPNWRIWGLEIMRNLVMAGSISCAVFLLLSFAFPGFTIPFRFRSLLGVGILLMIGGPLGGYVGWQLNEALFGFQVSSTVMGFALKMGALATLLGISPILIVNLWRKLSKTMLRLHQKELDAQRLLQLKTKAELEALRAKLNPHFLFNTLNSIASLIPLHPENAEKMVQKLAHLFRYTLNASNVEMVALEEELAFIRSYLEIEKIRLGDKLVYEIAVDSGLADFRLPGLLLQPIVENAVIHGIAKQEKGGRLSLCCRRVEAGCRIRIEDDGGGPGHGGIVKGFGLSAVTERLDLLYGEAYSFKITQRRGPRVEMYLPQWPAEKEALSNTDAGEVT